MGCILNWHGSVGGGWGRVRERGSEERRGEESGAGGWLGGRCRSGFIIPRLGMDREACARWTAETGVVVLVRFRKEVGSRCSRAECMLTPVLARGGAGPDLPQSACARSQTRTHRPT